MPDSYYYWFDNTDKGIKPPKVRPIIKKDVEQVIEEYVVHVKDNDELDKVPRLIKNVKRYTTTWGGKWDKEKQEKFEGWIKDAYNSLMNKELRTLADDHLQDWGDFFEGLHLSGNDTTVGDLLSGKNPQLNIRQFAGYQFADPETDLGEAQRNLSMQRKSMNLKEFLNGSIFKDLKVENTKSGNTILKFKLEHSDGKIQKEIFRNAFPNAQINTKKNPARLKSVANYSNVIRQESFGGKQLPKEKDTEKLTTSRNNKYQKGLENIFAIENVEDKQIWEDIFITDVKQIEVKKPKKIKVDKNKIYEYELKPDNELMGLFTPKKEKRWELEDEEGEEIEYPEQVDWEESQEDFQQRVSQELSKIKKLPKKIKVKRIKGLDDKADYVTLDGKKFNRSEMEYYNPIKSGTPIEENKEYKLDDFTKNKFKNYISTTITKLLPKSVLQEEPPYIEIGEGHQGIPIMWDKKPEGKGETLIDIVWPMVEKWVENDFNSQFIEPVIYEIINSFDKVVTSREKKMKELIEKYSVSKGSELNDVEIAHIERYLLDRDDKLEGFKESEIKKHSAKVSSEVFKKINTSLINALSKRREVLSEFVKSKPFYNYLRSVGLNMNPWYLSDYTFELQFDPTLMLENWLKHKILTFIPTITEEPNLMISRKALIATQGKKSSIVTPELSSQPRGGKPATASVEYTKEQYPPNLVRRWKDKMEEAKGEDKDGKKKVLEEIGKEKRKWQTDNIKGFNEAKEFWGQRILARTNKLKKLAPYIKEGTE